MHGEPVGAIFERIFLGDRLAGQLAVLADQQQAGAEPLGQRGGDDEAARLDAGDQVRLVLDPEGEPLDRRGEALARRAAGW